MNLDNIIGQTRAKERLKLSISSYQNGGDMTSPLFTAAAGVGKTVVAEGYLNDLDAVGVLPVAFSSPEELRSEGEGWDKFLDFLYREDPAALFIDEAHLLNYRRTVRLDKLRAFLMKSLDGNNRGKIIKIDDEIQVPFDRKKKAIILATNFPHILDESGALQSRFDHIQLEEYNEQELKEIFYHMLDKNGLTCEEDAAISVSKCGRGTARPLEKLTDELKKIALSNSITNPLTKSEVKRALRLCGMYPLGVSKDELDILRLCNKSANKSAIAATITRLEPAALNKSLGFLSTQKFICYTPQGYVTTNTGKTFLKQLKQLEFIE